MYAAKVRIRPGDGSAIEAGEKDAIAGISCALGWNTNLGVPPADLRHIFHFPHLLNFSCSSYFVAAGVGLPPLSFPWPAGGAMRLRSFLPVALKRMRHQRRPEKKDIGVRPHAPHIPLRENSGVGIRVQREIQKKD